MKIWQQNLNLEDLPNEDIRIIADLYGIEFALTLLNDLPGVVINIPSNALKKIRNSYICRNYDGSKKSRMQLALECEVTECYIKRLAWLHKRNEESERLAS
ncbi:MAG TPA: hypothetical protein P5556_00885 [Candidatus Gastranaerophilales bacterium]|nr:hypothetical protein [Candidatus Gastranaerophilales bacterium]